jgi:type III restriction enzyme
MKDGTVKEKTVTVRPGEGLEAKANRPEYAGYEIDEINAGFAYVRFTNEVELSIGEAKGADKDAIFAAQIEETIHKHFEKQHRLRERGIKVLSLFFIDRVDNYAPADGMIRRLFSETFDRLKVKHPAWAAVAPGAVQASYFAQKKRKGGEMEMLDSTSGKNEADIAAYNLIMREKEKLLSFDEPVSFIFSHSALREGWDNPNVFQICTLNQTSSEMKKRQEVGRGVRLCVNQHGERVLDEHVNVLTVIANESYERYVDTLQQEIEVEYGKAGVPPKPPRAERPKALLRKARALSPEFQALWERIKQKTRYAVQIDTERLIGEVVYHLQLTPIRPPRVSVTTASVGVVGGNQFEARQMTGARTAVNLAGRYMLPNLMQIMVNMLEHTTPSMRVSRRTLIAILRRVIDKRCVVDNPHDFATVAVKIIKERLADHLVNGIRYQRINAWYEMAQILGEEEIEIFGQYIVPTSNDNALYDHIACDSLVEQQFVHDLEHRQDVKLYLKLPSWFTVPTPVGEYNPDWAIVMDTPDGDRLYLVRETKSAGEELRPTEKRKTLCGERHFQGALGVSYKIVSSAREL